MMLAYCAVGLAPAARFLAVAGIAAACALSLLPAPAMAAVLVIPSPPIPAQPVVIRVSNQYGSEAFITSATISRTGNLFTINQAVTVVCALPNAPTLRSDFLVGVLPPGGYQVRSEIVYTGFGPGCNPARETQTASFSVAEAFAVPVGSSWSYLAIAMLLALTGLRRLGRREA
ncbi:MAG TPA: hypothetical protein VFP36_09535 [Usitatibacter sp.]|nr:hypothetical protein [Usitatibacter sp.]